MTRRCADCLAEYDDARQWTLCPHELLMDPALLDRKARACELIGREVFFAHRPPGEPARLVMTVHWDGMIELEGMPGQFAPHLFVFAE